MIFKTKKPAAIHTIKLNRTGFRKTRRYHTNTAPAGNLLADRLPTILLALALAIFSLAINARNVTISGHNQIADQKLEELDDQLFRINGIIARKEYFELLDQTAVELGLGNPDQIMYIKTEPSPQ